MRLIICGNGFDIHHGLKTAYSDYRRYLDRHAPFILKSFESFPWLNIVCRGELWRDLENSLMLNFQGMIDFYNRHYDDPIGNEEYKTDFEDWTRFIYAFTGDEFYKWISSDIGIGKEDKSLAALFENAVCVTFNYTDTIERLYGVDSKSVLHIHGFLNNVMDENCLGRDVLPSFNTIEESELLESPVVESDKWNSDVIRSEIQFGAPLIEGNELKNALLGLRNARIRDALNVLAEKTNKKIFENLPRLNGFLEGKEIDEIVILGQSLLGPDDLYYSECLVPLFKNIKWTAYYYCPEDKEEKSRFFEKYGIKPEYKAW